jgi:hypothetical protein
MLAGRASAVAAGLTLLAWTAGALAQVEPAPEWPEPEWTVVTVARNGAWGVSTARTQGEAIAGALRQCERKSARQDPGASDCGAELVAYKVGWSLAMLCGEHRVLVSAATLADAEAAAADRIDALEQLYASPLPPCRRLLMVDPAGSVTPRQRPMD